MHVKVKPHPLAEKYLHAYCYLFITGDVRLPVVGDWYLAQDGTGFYYTSETTVAADIPSPILGLAVNFEQLKAAPNAAPKDPDPDPDPGSELDRDYEEVLRKVRKDVRKEIDKRRKAGEPNPWEKGPRPRKNTEPPWLDPYTKTIWLHGDVGGGFNGAKK